MKASIIDDKVYQGCIIAAIVVIILFTAIMFVATARAEICTASWYSRESCRIEGTSGICADGSRLNDSEITCASWDYPFGTKLLIRYGSKTIVATVTDRGPSKRLYRKGRKIDLSRGAFVALAPLSKGVIKVNYKKLTERR
ncbi:MAG: septal ring lytic transglycosylase RlpA family protein [Janthinobacterium sp.]|jgi:rare lipoprotein A (peptidoglycan hydrolase)